DSAFDFQLYQVPAVSALSAHDTRARDPGPGPLRSTPGATRPAADHLRPGAALLLPAAHSAHPRVRGATRLLPLRLVAAGGRPARRGRAPPARSRRLTGSVCRWCT